MLDARSRGLPIFSSYNPLYSVAGLAGRGARWDDRRRRRFADDSASGAAVQFPSGHRRRHGSALRLRHQNRRHRGPRQSQDRRLADCCVARLRQRACIDRDNLRDEPGRNACRARGGRPQRDPRRNALADSLLGLLQALDHPVGRAPFRPRRRAGGSRGGRLRSASCSGCSFRRPRSARARSGRLRS